MLFYFHGIVLLIIFIQLTTDIDVQLQIVPLLPCSLSAHLHPIQFLSTGVLGIIRVLVQLWHIIGGVGGAECIDHMVFQVVLPTHTVSANRLPLKNKQYLSSIYFTTFHYSHNAINIILLLK